MEGGGVGGESPNGVVIDDPVGQGGQGYYDFDAELNDVVCALCGDGGELLCCEGPCLRSYHATIATGQPSGCRSLGFTAEQVEAMEHFICHSCRTRQHQGEGYYDFDAELNDVVCALCGDGGELLCCEGPCLRSYHATIATGQPSGCRSLGFTAEQVEAMQHFICHSCRTRQHRCASCGIQGSSGVANHPQDQVFRCNHETCGRFYHALCISAELHPGDPAEAGRCRVRVAAGRPFWCRRPHRPRGIFEPV